MQRVPSTEISTHDRTERRTGRRAVGVVYVEIDRYAASAVRIGGARIPRPAQRSTDCATTSLGAGGNIRATGREAAIANNRSQHSTDAQTM